MADNVWGGEGDVAQLAGQVVHILVRPHVPGLLLEQQVDGGVQVVLSVQGVWTGDVQVGKPLRVWRLLGNLVWGVCLAVPR